MATYKEIHGVKVQYRDSDATAIEGDVWYNASTGLLKMYASLGSWASATSVNTGRDYSVGSGTTTAGLIFGGAASTAQTVTESYDGSSWTEVGDLNAATSQAGGATSGSQTATLSFGMPPGVNESWNGTAWTEVGDMGTGRYIGQASGGTSAAAICMGGPPNQALTETFNGTAWSEVGDLNTGRAQSSGCGSSTSTLIMGGRSPATGKTEAFDGSSWSETGDLNTARYYNSAAGESSALAITFAGLSTTAKTEQFDGSSWTEVGDLLTASAYGGGGVGTATSALMVGVAPPASYPALVNEWNVAAAAETVAFD